jgi:hypothetical protein
MPNWCNNEVTIEGDITKIKQGLDEEQELFSIMFPKPESVEDWYSWNLENWGTKWDTTPEVLEVTENSIKLSFDTAWGPPIQFYEKMEETGYKINATYFESGMFFVGQYSEGIDESWDIDDSTVPEELKEYWNIEEFLEYIREEV